MKLPAFIASLLFLTCPAHTKVTSRDGYQHIQIYYQPTTPSASNSAATLLASIDYDITNLDSKVISYSPPSFTSGEDDNNNNNDGTGPNPEQLFRILTTRSTDGGDDGINGATTISSLSNFNPAYTPTLTLHLTTDDSIFAASLSADPLSPSPPPSSSSSPPASPPPSQPHQPTLKVTILRPTPGPAPALNAKKPVLLDADGKEVVQPPEVEKTLFQKYWWALALIGVLAISGSADK